MLGNWQILCKRLFCILQNKHLLPCVPSFLTTVNMKSSTSWWGDDRQPESEPATIGEGTFPFIKTIVKHQRTGVGKIWRPSGDNLWKSHGHKILTRANEIKIIIRTPSPDVKRGHDLIITSKTIRPSKDRSMFFTWLLPGSVCEPCWLWALVVLHSLVPATSDVRILWPVKLTCTKISVKLWFDGNNVNTIKITIEFNIPHITD